MKAQMLGIPVSVSHKWLNPPVIMGVLALLVSRTFVSAGTLDPIVHIVSGGGSVKIVKCYPEGKMRASCQSFDDGTLGAEWPVLDALRKRGLTATFFMNSRHLQSQDAVKYPRRYAGFEVASHGASHKGFAGMPEGQVRDEIETDQKILGDAFGQVIDGFAYPYGNVPKEAADLVKLENQLRALGLIYARWTGGAKDYAPPADFMRWKPNCGFLAPVEEFLAAPAEETVCVRMSFTHSIGFARGQISFDAWEKILDRLAAETAIWNVSMRDYARYVMALRALEKTEAGLRNNAAIAVWVRVKGRAIAVPANSTLAWSAL
jgi:peptidoglycan/xylan/chitin deacetylase (PgdA/CDA1 family)